MKKIICFFTFFFMGILIANAEVYDAILIKCIDGDTAVFSTDGQNEEKYRFISIDAPEVLGNDDNYGITSSNYVCDILTNAQEVLIEVDPKATTDKYDRKLGWVWVDKKLLQEEIIMQGLAKVAYVYDDEYKYAKSLCVRQQEAMLNKVGLWKNINDIGYCSKLDLDDIKVNINYKKIGKIDSNFDESQKRLYDSLKKTNTITEKIENYSSQNHEQIVIYLFYIIMGVAILYLCFKAFKNK